MLLSSAIESCRCPSNIFARATNHHRLSFLLHIPNLRIPNSPAGSMYATKWLGSWLRFGFGFWSERGPIVIVHDPSNIM